MVEEFEKHLTLEQRVKNLEEALNDVLPTHTKALASFESHLESLEKEVNSIQFSTERFEFEQELLKGRRALTSAVMGTMTNNFVTFLDVRRRYTADDPNAFERGAHCMQQLREHTAKYFAMLPDSDEPEKLIGGFEERALEILDEHNFPFARRLG